MRQATALLAAASALLLADAASAQGQSPGMRYLSWNDRPRTQPQPTAAAPPAGRGDGLRRPNMVIPHGGFAQVENAAPRLTPAPGGRHDGLTPANAWLARRGAMPSQPAAPRPDAPAPTPAPAGPSMPRDEVAYGAPPASQVEAPRELIPPGYPDYMPGRGYREYVPGEVIMPVTPQGEPVYHGEDGRPVPQAPSRPTMQGAPAQYQPQAMTAPHPQPQAVQPAPDAAADPMAPRRDAPIFRMQQAARPAPQPQPQQSAPPTPQPEPARVEAAQTDPNAPRRVAMVTTNTADRPGRDQGARYYSLHRQNGQRPDGIALPEPTYVDALAVNLAETPASQDLAAPDRGPTLIRDNQGRLRAAPAASEGDHQ